ncbi:hypothetical protein J3458_015228 [Metarhizium acridum]|uniref:uncharacterized protein n=1 Tax=Metarhizium acridum TaxID=92637 RepID=UPI001C6B42A8|nr:hypothetical protein J3458_015141 [Metarhizium acridum]KAG8411934.1 hypothetical protein J3458_015228 [Metarhizium acridum]
MVDEFATSAFLSHKLKNGRHVLVVPISESAIASATSDSLVTLAERAGWTVERMQLPFSALGELDEVAAVGTAAAAVPIRALDRLSTGDKLVFPGSGEMSNISHLASLMDAIQRGRQQDVDGWCWKVTGFATAKQKFKNGSTAVSNAKTTV